MKKAAKLSQFFRVLGRLLRKFKWPKLSRKAKIFVKQGVFICLSVMLFVFGASILWFATLQIPDLESFDQRILGQSTKIFDKTGKILLYDMGQNMRRTIVPLDQISEYAKQATIAIEDAEFYNHHGVRPTSIIRATIANLSEGEFTQGGSTITQQVIKNALLTKDKTIARKIKEIMLAIKLERVYSKDEILHLYLNESPYGGTVYGVEEAAQVFFGKTARDLNLVESAYLAALPQAPSYYSPYGKHRDELEKRKNLVLLKMKENGFIDENAYNDALKEIVVFESGSSRGIKAPHFVMFIRQYLEEQYGDRVVAEGGLKVITTIDYELQKKAEEIVNKYAHENAKNFHATNASLVAIDATTGQILVMVGSRDYFDEEIEGNYNIATAKRQPGSSFKPFIYVKAFDKGYRPETVLFDLKTQFSTNCSPSDLSSDENGCYSPENYDNKFRGPMTLRSALGQSINIPAVKLFYLVGMDDTLDLVRKLGITTLTDKSRFGLSLVLGGGEVTLLDMTSAYSVFSQNGVKRKTTGIIKVEDRKGNILEEWIDESEEVINKQSVLLLTDVLKDNAARQPSFSANSALYFPDREVAAKTGTSNDYRDTWILGYTPQIAVGAWAGNNDNSPIEKRVAGMVVAPMWHAFMDEILKTLPDEKFERPEEVDLSKLPPAISGKLNASLNNDSIRDIHSILYYVNKNDPLGPAPRNPAADPQFPYWEHPIRLWAANNGVIPDTAINPLTGLPISAEKVVRFINPTSNQQFQEKDVITVRIGTSSEDPIRKSEYFLNGEFLGSPSEPLADFTFSLAALDSVKRGNNSLKVIVTDSSGKQSESSVVIKVR